MTRWLNQRTMDQGKCSRWRLYRQPLPECHRRTSYQHVAVRCIWWYPLLRHNRRLHLQGLCRDMERHYKAQFRLRLRWKWCRPCGQLWAVKSVSCWQHLHHKPCLQKTGWTFVRTGHKPLRGVYRSLGQSANSHQRVPLRRQLQSLLVWLQWLQLVWAPRFSLAQARLWLLASQKRKPPAHQVALCMLGLRKGLSCTFCS